MHVVQGQDDFIILIQILKSSQFNYQNFLFKKYFWILQYSKTYILLTVQTICSIIVSSQTIISNIFDVSLMNLLEMLIIISN